MKSKNLHSWIGGAAAMLILSLAASCTDEDMFQRPDTGNGIAFLPSIVNKGWSAGDSTQTRTAVPASRHSVTELRNDQGGKSLYLHTTETDSIATPAAPDTARIATRGAVVTTTTFAEQYGGFGVLAFAYKEGSIHTNTPNFIYNEETTLNGGTYGFNPPHFWPSKDYTMSFFLYAPYNGAGITLSEKDHVGAPTLTYTVPDKIEEQQDILALLINGLPYENRAYPLQVKLSHICTAVQFKVGKGLNNIQSIMLKNVYGKGTYTSLFADGNGWNEIGTIKDFTLSLDDTTPTPEGTDLTAGDKTFMMIPQTLPDDAEIEVTFTENGQTQKLTANISGHEWLKGHTVIYKISRMSIEKEPTFEITPPVDAWTWEGGTKTYQIKSYADVTGEGITAYQEPMKWKITGYSTDEGENKTWKPVGNGQSLGGWLTLSTLEGDGSIDAQDAFTATVAEQSGVTYNEHNDKLRATPKVTDFDLSTNGGTWGTVNTANCYIVNAAGTYKLPLIYGNAIKNGQTNKAAYHTDKKGENILRDFVDYKDKQINSPFIEKGDIKVNDACLVWQDEMNLVEVESELKEETITLNGESQEVKFLHFTITDSEDYLKQGNAIVAVRDAEGTIVWSWHIWVTDYVWGTSKKMTNITGQTYDMMTVNVGWCDGETTTYAGRKMWLRIEPELGEPKVVEVVQDPFERPYLGNNPYYQWGRKDPMLPAIQKTLGDEDTSGNWEMGDKDCHPGDANYEYKCLDEVYATIGESIQTPYIFYSTENNNSNVSWTGTRKEDCYENLWNITMADEKTVPVKSIYDPCPVGFCLPPKLAFSGITLNGKEVGRLGTADQLKKVNTPFDNQGEAEDVHGWEFYCNPMTKEGKDPSGGTLYFPFSGSRLHYDNQASSMDLIGYYWTTGVKYDNSSQYNVYFADALSVGSVVINPENRSSLASGYIVRPVRESN